MPVQVERRLDRRVAEVGGYRLRVHAGRDQEAGEGVTTLMQADRIETGSTPCRQGSLADRRRREGLRCARAEDETVVAPSDEFVLDEEVAERGDDRDAAPAGAALRLTGLAMAVHAVLDADQTAGEIDVVPLESSQLT